MPALITPFEALACPLDGAPLHGNGPTRQCPAGHSFDVAAHGYLNLLPVQHKRSRDPGDSKEMVAARRRFLDSGCYQPIAAAVSQAVLPAQAHSGTLACLDAGCGEGYYLRELATAAQARGQALSVLGVDISKWAVQAAARRSRQMAWVVGSNAGLPVLDASVDRVLCMFGFPVFAEFARVLKAGGELLLVDAGPDHLRELREIIYPSLKPERPAPATGPAPLHATTAQQLRFAVTLENPQQIADLLAMTPHLYRATAAGRARAAALQHLQLTVDVRLQSLRREPS